MAVKTYGKIMYDYDNWRWSITECQPHVCIRLKKIFPKIPVTGTVPFHFNHTPENCHDLSWFMERYPLSISEDNAKLMDVGKRENIQNINEVEAILLPDYKPSKPKLKDNFEARGYQLTGRDVLHKVKRLIIGDDTGLGKTMISLLSAIEPGKLPMAVIVQTHLPKQWKDRIEEFTDLKMHVIKNTSPYNLPEADIYIFKYSQLAGWVNFFGTGFFKSAHFDEAQELRRCESQKYKSAQKLSESCEYVLGLSATPIYNFGDEIFNILNLIKPGCLGYQSDFMREWTTNGRNVSDPAALGTYLRENFLMLRRTRAEVGREMPAVNRIVHTVDYDNGYVEKSHELAMQLATKVVSGTFMERGQAAREFDMRMRHDTGVAKAKSVAAYVRMLLENGEPVLLAGWHRAVYEIWAEELADFNPVFYTGTESPAQKEKSKKDFMEGESNLMFISLRSGIGLDGLQGRCSTVVIGELDWSPNVHYQIISRVDRDMQTKPVMAIFLVCEYGSDPVIVDLLAVKSSQSSGIVDPLAPIQTQHSDDSRIKIMAEKFLGKKQNEVTLA